MIIYSIAFEVNDLISGLSCQFKSDFQSVFVIISTLQALFLETLLFIPLNHCVLDIIHTDSVSPLERIIKYSRIF